MEEHATRAKLLVSPDRTLYAVCRPDVVKDKNELMDLCKQLRIGWQLEANLRQLCDWDKVGKDRSGRDKAQNWQLPDRPLATASFFF